MAANSRSAGAIASLRKRITNQIWTSDPLRYPAISPSAHKFRRAAHNSVYEKNPDEPTRPSSGPDDVIQPQADKYWAPHPQTGVFGPATEPTATGAAGAASPNRGLPAANAEGDDYSVAEEEKAWFRPTGLEDSEKPHVY